MAIPLKYATASQEIPLGFFVDDSDGNTEETGLTISNTDIWLWKAGATTIANKNSGGATHIQNGIYYCTLDATDTNTYGPLIVFVHESGALPVRVECVVMEADAFDALYAAAGTGHIEADAVQISGDATAANNAELAYDGTGYGFTGCTMPTVTTLTGHTAQTGDNYARLGAPAGASIAADIAENQTDLDTVIADTNELQTDWTNGGRLDLIIDELTTQGDTNEGKIDTVDGIVDNILVDTGTTLDAALAVVDANVDAILVDTGTTLDGKLDDIQGATFDTATDSLEAIRDRGDAAWTTGGGGSISDILNVTPLVPMSIDLANTATVRLGLMLTNALDDLPSTAEITPGTIDIDRKAIGGTSWSSVVSGAACSEAAGLVYYDEVFDSGTGYAEGDSLRITFKSQSITVAANDYEISDATGRMFYTEIRQTMRGTDSAALAATALTNATWTDARAGYLDELGAANMPADLDAVLLDTGTTLPATLTTIEGKVDTVDGNVDAILVDTNEVQTDLTDGGRLDLLIDGIKASTDNLPADPADDSDIDTQLAAITSAISGLNDPTAAAIADQVWEETLADHSGTAGSTAEALGNASAPTAAQVRAEIDSNSTQLAAIVADTNELQTDDVPGRIAALNDPSAGAIADQVWEEALADHSGTGGSTAEALNAAGAAGDPWITALPGAYGSGSAGYIIGTFIDQAISAGLTASQVWAHLTRTLTQSAASVVAVVSGDDVTVQRLTSWSISLTGLGDISSRTKLYFTVKDDFGDTDAKSLFQVEETAGLLYLDGDDADDSTDGSLTVDDQSLGNITIAADTDGSNLTAGIYLYDVKMVTASAVQVLTTGKIKIQNVVTKAVT